MRSLFADAGAFQAERYSFRFRESHPKDGTMRATAVILLGLAFCSTAIANSQVPSQEALADVGLLGMQILSDEEAASVRGMGFDGVSFRDFKNDFFQGVRSIRRDIRGAKIDVKNSIREVNKLFRPMPGRH
jgi:hypothetical protein